MPIRLRIGSLCTGYGGLDLAVTAALADRGIEAVTEWVADPDPGAAAVLGHHWPDAPNLGDITSIDWATVPRVDVLTAGFPCQDVSVAGRSAGLAPGTRSGLWAHVAHAIASLNPRIVVIENVPGLLSARADRGMGPGGTPLDGDTPPGTLRAAGAVLGDLAGLGLDAEWASIRASDIGAPHRRERVFLLAWPASDPGGPRLALRGKPHHGPQRAAVERGRGESPADTSGDGRQQGRPESARLSGRPDAAERRCAAAAHADDRPVSPLPDRRAHRPEAHHDDHEQHAPGRVLDRWGSYGPAVRRWEQVTGRPAPAPTEPGRTGRPRLSPRFVEWLMGLDEGHVTAVPGLSRTSQLRLLGNGVVPQQGSAGLRLLLDRAQDGTDRRAEAAA